MSKPKSASKKAPENGAFSKYVLICKRIVSIISDNDVVEDGNVLQNA